MNGTHLIDNKAEHNAQVLKIFNAGLEGPLMFSLLNVGRLFESCRGKQKRARAAMFSCQKYVVVTVCDGNCLGLFMTQMPQVHCSAVRTDDEYSRPDIELKILLIEECYNYNYIEEKHCFICISIALIDC